MRTKPQPSQPHPGASKPHPGASSACSYAVRNPSMMCAITHARDTKENGVSRKTVYLRERNWPWVSEVARVLRKKNPACTHRQFIPLHCRKGMQQSMRADRHQDDTPEESPSTIFRIVTLQCPFARHSDGPADFIPLGVFHRSVRRTLPSNAKSREGRRENRVNQAKVRRYTTASSGCIILLGQPCMSEQRPCQTCKSFPHPASTSVLRLSIMKKRIWILKPFKSMPTAGANKNKSELWAMLITAASFH